jgi:hypothetical protein
MPTCPNCTEAIPWKTIVFAACPVWISCPACRASLVGGGFIKLQAIEVLATTVIFTLAVLISSRAWEQRVPILLIGALIISLANTFITLKWGKYVPRKTYAS